MPQFCGSDAAFTHCEPQGICAPLHVGTPLPPVPVGVELTFPSQPSSGAIASAATTGRIQAFIATTFRTSIRTRIVSVASRPKMREIIRKYSTRPCVFGEPVFVFAGRFGFHSGLVLRRPSTEPLRNTPAEPREAESFFE